MVDALVCKLQGCYEGYAWNPYLPGLQATQAGTTCGVLLDTTTDVQTNMPMLAAWNRAIMTDPYILATQEPVYTTPITQIKQEVVITQEFCWGLDISVTNIPGQIDRWYGSSSFANYGVVQPIYGSGASGLAKWINRPHQRVFFEYGKVVAFIITPKTLVELDVQPFLRPAQVQGYAADPGGAFHAIEPFA